MQAVAYEGYFNKGQFYVLGKTIPVPEKKRIVITIFDDTQPTILEEQKKEILLRLYGSCPDSNMAEPPEIPMEHELPRRYDLI